MRALRTLLVVGLVLGMSGQAIAADNADATASATIITPIGITKNVDLAFGNIYAATSAGTVVLAPTSGTPTRTPTTVTLGTTTGTVTAAKFTMSGTTGMLYTVTLPATPPNLTGPGTAMTVDTWTTSLTLSQTTGTIATAPADDIFYVGGKLHVGASQTPGAYSGTFNISVAYN